MDMNNCTFTGHLGRDAKLRRPKTGDPVLSFSIAVNGYKKDAPPTWVNCSLFGKRGETLEQYLTQGTRCAVVGRISLREYEGNDGEPKSSLDLVVNDVVLLGSKKDGDAGEKRSEKRDTKQTKKSTAPDDFAPDGDDDDDIPF